MNQLLDTHTLIWFLNGDIALSETAKNRILQEGVYNFVSIASIWEIAINVSLGKLEIKKKFSELEIWISENGFQLLPINFRTLLCSLLYLFITGILLTGYLQHNLSITK
jgi:PIN domain nuclease of toxin-antitoxin system